MSDFVASLESGRAPVFLDTAMKWSRVYEDRELYGHEQVPEVAEAVRRNYFLCAELPGARLFLNRKRYQTQPGITAWCAGLESWKALQVGQNGQFVDSVPPSTSKTLPVTQPEAGEAR